MDRAIRGEVGAAVGVEVRDARPLSGGDINQAFAVELADGRRLFVKCHRSADPRMFRCEARGLAWLAEADALRLPEVIAVGDRFLALELLEPGARIAGYSRALGRGLAALHAFGADRFGFDEDNFLATLEQDNTPEERWSDFYSRRRLEPLVQRAIDHGHAPDGWGRDFARLFARMDELAGPPEPPARLHGDLWSGNLHTAPDGQPALIDPAVYGGHREIDLAMLRLFGSPGPDFFAAYHERYPLAAGHEERVALYQLYPLLAHVNLFGGGYVSSVERALRRYV